MADFFEPMPPLPEPPPQPQHRTPPWLAAPRGVLPGSLPLGLVLARTEHVAVCITHLDAYPSGFGLDLIVMAAVDDPDLDPHMFLGRWGRGPRGTHEREGYEQMLRFGVEFADGSKATNTDVIDLPDGTMHRMVAVSADDEPVAPKAPVLNLGGGSGGGTWTQNIWIWPLPPAGPLVFACQWPAARIESARAEIDAGRVIDAGSHAQTLFADSDD